MHLNISWYNIEPRNPHTEQPVSYIVLYQIYTAVFFVPYTIYRECRIPISYINLIRILSQMVIIPAASSFCIWDQFESYNRISEF